MSSAVTGKGVPVKVPNRSSRLSVLRFVRMAVAFVVVAGSLGLATVAATAQSGGSCPSDGAPAYSDVPESSFAYDDSRCLREKGISDAGDTYRPGDDMTRSEMAAFMANAYAALKGMEAPIESHMFTDVAGDPNAEDIARISPNGLMITTGTSDTTYSPNDPVIRSHMALFLTRLYKAVSGMDAPVGGDTGFGDIGGLNAEQQAAIASLKHLGVTTGTSSTTYSPGRNVTREEMASFVARMFRVIDAMTPAVTGVEVTPSGTAGTAVKVSWTAVEGADSYVVQWGEGFNNQQTTTATMVTISGLTKGTAVNVRVAVVKGGEQSAWASASGTPGTVAGKVGDLKAVASKSAGIVNVTWSVPKDDGGTPLTGYKVVWTKGHSTDRQSASISNPAATSYTLSGLSGNSLYFVWVVAVNGAGDSPEAGPVSVTPVGTIKSGAARLVLRDPDSRTADTGKRFHQLIWPSVPLLKGQHAIDSTIQRKCGTQLWPDAIIPNDASRIHSQTFVATTANQSVANNLILGGSSGSGTLTNGVECTFRIRVNVFVDTDNDKEKDPTEQYATRSWVEVSGTPTKTPAPPAVLAEAVRLGQVIVGNRAVEGTLAGNRLVQVSWRPPEIPETYTGGPITGYRVILESPQNIPVTSVSVDADVDTYTFTGLNNAWTYAVRVIAMNASGSGDASGTTTTELNPGPGPNVPTNLRITQSTKPTHSSFTFGRGHTLELRWDVPSTNSAAAVNAYYVLRRDSDTDPNRPGNQPGAWGPTGVGINGTMYEQNFLTAGKSYDFRVRAGSTTPNPGPWSVIVSGTPTKVPNAVNTNRIAVVNNNGSATLIWPASAANGSKVTHYTVQYQKNNCSQTVYRDCALNNAGSVPGSMLMTKTITGLTNGSTYKVTIKAVSALGASAAATKDVAPVATGSMHRAPTSVKAVAVPNAAGAALNVTWNAVSRATSYQVSYLAVAGEGVTDVNPTSWTGETTVTTNKASFTTGLEENRTYVVRVRATAPTEVASLWGFSAPVKAERSPYSDTGRVADNTLSVVQIAGTSTLRVNWISLSAANSKKYRVTGYEVSWKPTNAQVSGNSGKFVVAAPAKPGVGVPMSYDITGLTAIGQSIRVTVKAVNNVGPATGDDNVRMKDYPPSG